MARRARNTNFIQIRTKAAAQEHRAMMDDPIIWDLYMTTLAALRRALSHADGVSFPLSAEERENLMREGAADSEVFGSNFRLLVGVMRDRAPKVARRWGDNFEKRVFGWLCEPYGIDLPSSFTDLMERPERFSPDNPIQRLAENIYYIPEDVNEFGNAKHRYACLRELDGYLTAIQDHKPRGRPPQEPKKQPAANQRKTRKIDPTKAVQAYEMEQAGLDAYAIAQALLPQYDLTDAKQRNQARGVVRNWVEKGYLLVNFPQSQPQDPPSTQK